MVRRHALDVEIVGSNPTLAANMSSNDILIEEYRALRKEINSRMKLIHFFVFAATCFGLIFLIAGIWLYSFVSLEIFYTYLLLIPLIYVGLIFNYQDNQRALEATARYQEEKIKPKLDKLANADTLEWEMWFVGFKKKVQFSSSYKIFPFILPFVLPIILLINSNLTRSQLYLVYIDLLFFIIVLANFRYKLFRLK